MRVEVEVRAAGPEDLRDVGALCLAAREETGTGAQICSAGLEKVTAQVAALLTLPGGRALVATLHGRLVGIALTRVAGPSVFLDHRVLYLEVLYVQADARRHGVGHALLSGVAGLAEEAGAFDVFAAPVPGARGFQRFLARLGFAPAASHRHVATVTLQRRLAAEHHPSHRHAHARPGLEELIARRRRSRAGIAPGRAPGRVDPMLVPELSDAAAADEAALALGADQRMVG